MKTLPATRVLALLCLGKSLPLPREGGGHWVVHRVQVQGSRGCPRESVFPTGEIGEGRDGLMLKLHSINSLLVYVLHALISLLLGNF